MTKKISSDEAVTMDVAGENAESNQDLNGAKGEGVPAAAAQAEQGEAEKQSLQAQLAEFKDRYVRLLADFENFKRRALKEQSELLKYQGEKLVVDMLEVLDTLELALSHTSASQESLKTGLERVHQLFVEKLGRWEIRGESGLGSQFDPQKHSAISQVPGEQAGVIVGELKKPYFYKDKLIRCGEVVVSAASDKS